MGMGLSDKRPRSNSLQQLLLDGSEVRFVERKCHGAVTLSPSDDGYGSEPRVIASKASWRQHYDEAVDHLEKHGVK